MPAFVKTPKDERKWKRAKNAVKRAKKKPQKDFSNRDWGLTTHIFQRIKKSVKFICKAEKLVGGRGDYSNDGDFDQHELKMGIEIEMEHTADKDMAAEIARDHLSEDPKYYTHLKEMEKKYQ